ncbi:alpha/beta-Hydrolases superfamily protein [Abeliophyllum distichum]|uniref:Alpha/beta-Hydrolases superfamily protein n=1 Tax=Abeliophyllum distichum TaxID=126358 RepID=A0ABD1W0R2_9LAMI
MIRWLISALQLAELFVSSLAHLAFGIYIFSTAVAGDLSQVLSDWFFIFKPNLDVGLKGDDSKRASSVDDLPPIVLVHGIFGFGKGRLGGLSYFAGAETKDDRVLVPDLGSLTSIYDRARELFYYLKGGQVDYGEEHSKACGGTPNLGGFMKQGITLNGMRIIPFTLLDIQPEHRLFGFCNKCSPIRHSRGMKILQRIGC